MAMIAFQALVVVTDYTYAAPAIIEPVFVYVTAACPGFRQSPQHHGMAMRPLNQPIEMIDRERQLGRAPAWAGRIARLTGDDWQATFSFRAGFATQSAPASPRRRLKDVLMG